MPKAVETGGAYVVSLIVPAEPRWLALCRLVLSGLCQVNAVDEETVADLKLAVTEACSNSVRHAYRDEGAGMIEVRYELRPDQLAVEVADVGQGFEFSRPVRELASPTDEEVRENEMGLAIIDALVDELDIGAGSNGRGTRITFSKRLAGAGTA